MEAIRKRFGRFGAHLAFSTIGIGVWSVVLFVTNIYAGRFLGPEEYGRYALTLSIASIMMIPMLFGLNTSMIKFGSGKVGRERNEIMGTSVWLIFLLATIFSCTFWWLEPVVSSHWSIGGDIWLWAIVLAVGLVVQYMADAVFRSLQAFKLQSAWLIIAALSLFAALFMLFFSFEEQTFRAYVLATVIGYGVLLLGAGFLFLKNNCFAFFSRQRARQLTHFGLYAMFGGVIGTLIMNIDRLMIGSFLDEQSVGLYMAYSIAATVIILKLTEVFVNVFFPKVSSMGRRDKAALFAKMKRPLVLTFVGLFFLTIASTIFTLFLFGEDYSVEPTLLVLFSVQAPLIAVSTILAWMISSCGVALLRRVTVFGILLLIVNIVCNALLIPVFEISGAVMATIITYALNYVYAYYLLKKSFAHDGA